VLEQVFKELIPSEKARESLFHLQELPNAVIEETLENALMLRHQAPCLTVSASDTNRTLPVSFKIDSSSQAVAQCTEAAQPTSHTLTSKTTGSQLNLPLEVPSLETALNLSDDDCRKSTRNSRDNERE
jgi:hypothetical protein